MSAPHVEPPPGWCCRAGRTAHPDPCPWHGPVEDGGVWEDRALRAEAEVQRLREVLKHIEAHMGGKACRWAARTAREALGEKP